jgi:hypothetical protein
VVVHERLVQNRLELVPIYRSPLFTSLQRPPSRPVAHRFRLPGSALARLLALGRVGNGMVVVVVGLGGTVGLPPPGLDGFLRRVGRDQAVAPGADKVLPSGLDPGFAGGEVILQPTGWPA